MAIGLAQHPDSPNHPAARFERTQDSIADMRRKARTDSIYAARSRGRLDFRKIIIPSRHHDLNVPAYLFAPLAKKAQPGHAAMIWLHGGVHANWDEHMLPFVLEAVDKGYVIMCPEYRGSTGYGRAYADALDYGGLELDDVLDALDTLERLSYVDRTRIGVMGWSHGAYIAASLVFRDTTTFVAAALIAPVSNLIVRLATADTAYRSQFLRQQQLSFLPFENPREYIARSPVYHVDNLRIPVLVQAATNDADMPLVEMKPLLDALALEKPDLAEIRVYDRPPGGHGFNRLVDEHSLARRDSPEQRDSWNRIWTFFDWWLRPYLPGLP